VTRYLLLNVSRDQVQGTLLVQLCVLFVVLSENDGVMKPMASTRNEFT
jgi:hypothetical protein